MMSQSTSECRSIETSPPDLPRTKDVSVRCLSSLRNYEACHREQVAAAAELSNPCRTMLYPTYTRLADSLAAIRLKCKTISLAIREHIRKKRPIVP